MYFYRKFDWLTTYVNYNTVDLDISNNSKLKWSDIATLLQWILSFDENAKKKLVT
jgi:hypothetical protein